MADIIKVGDIVSFDLRTSSRIIKLSGKVVRSIWSKKNQAMILFKSLEILVFSRSLDSGDRKLLRTNNPEIEIDFDVYTHVFNMKTEDVSIEDNVVRFGPNVRNIVKLGSDVEVESNEPLNSQLPYGYTGGYY